ncbi:ABC transporter permease subunit [Piscibacillus halophilus]|uniref:ABC transporter permease subunit n=1 Tax=Piscibacillus halophilus TaxID=571933 RepID=UPI00158C84DA|nr:ABC transporter permease subunit [Piscibacillus halophilus]
MKYIRRNAVLIFGMFLLVILLFITFVGPYLPGIDQELEETQYIWSEERIPIPPPYEPNPEYLLGSDHSGRDLVSLIVIGAKETLLIVLFITLVRYLVAIPLSYLAHKEWLGIHLFLKWINGFLSYVPTIIMVILLAMLPPFLFNENRIYIMILIIALVEVGRAAESIKLDLDDTASKEYILSGIVAGASPFRIFRHYLLPFVYGKLIVYIVSDVGKVMFLVGQLAFIGVFISQEIIQVDFGQFQIRNTSISWPMLLADAHRDIRIAIWIPFWTAFAMTFTIFTFNVLAQGFQNLFKKKNSYI